MAREWRQPLHAAPYRVWYYSNLNEQFMMMPVYELTAEYMHKDGLRIFVSTLEDNHTIGMSCTFRADPRIVRRDAKLMRNSDVRDRSGKFIFDGDILQSGTDDDPGERALCYYDKGTFSFTYWSQVVKDNKIVKDAWWGEGWEPYIGRLVTKTGRIRGLKIVGNICENPELLGYSNEDIMKIQHIHEIANGRPD